MNISAAQKLRTAMELHEVGVRMQRQRLQRTQPEASEEIINAQLAAWLRHRPGAQYGDYPGPPSRRFESK
ncbi:MAG: hypothetical protein ACR2JX_08350 [Mycobacteriales bacterium]